MTPRNPALSALALVCLALLPAAQKQKPKKPKQAGGQPGQEGQPDTRMKPGEGEATPGKKEFDPFFDYTHLAPPNETLWAPVNAAQVSMEAAWELIKTSETATLYPIKVELRPDPAGDYWAFEVFELAAGEEQPKRVNLRVSAAEPKVTKRLELFALAPDEEPLWKVLKRSKVELDIAVQLSKDHAVGNKANEPLITDARMRTIQFVPVPAAPYWQVEMMGQEIKSETIRRYGVQVNAKEPRLKRKLMLDRFAGEPLRNKHDATELPNGMFLADLTTGDGQEIGPDSRVKVNYRLFLLDNTKLHDTWQTELPEEFLVSQAPLKGMSEGMVGMRVGGKRKICMPFELGFGEKGTELAPPKAMVVCDIAIEELVGP